MESRSLVFERTYEAPIQDVWDALTKKELMKEWYFEVSDFKPEPGFRFSFIGENDGKKFIHHCMVTEVKVPVKLSYTWVYENHTGQSLVTFELKALSEETTHLKLTHSGVDTFPLDHPDFATANFQAGWTHFVDNGLKNFVEKGSIVNEVTITADAKRIWEVILNPNGKWGLAFGGGAIAETTWAEGAPVLWKDNYGNLGANGIVQTHVPAQLIVMQYYDNVHAKAGDPLGSYTEKIFIKPGSDGSMKLSIEAGPLKKKYLKSHGAMWDKAVVMIKELAEK